MELLDTPTKNEGSMSIENNQPAQAHEGHISASPETPASGFATAKSDFVSLGGRRLHYLAAGSGSPTIVLEAGLGVSSVEWALVFPRLAEFSRVVAYDRAGMGRSEPDAAPRTVRRLVADLHMLLKEAAIPGPYLLVGHSWGGLLIRLFAYCYPEEVAGLVLIDPSHEDLSQFHIPGYQLLTSAVFQMTEGMARLKMQGLLRSLMGEMKQIANILPAKDRDQFMAEFLDPIVHRTIRQEMSELPAGCQTMREVSKQSTLPDVPFVVLTGAVAPKYQTKVRAEITRLHAQLAASTPKGKQIMAPKSGHYIPQDDPDLVVETIRQMVEEIRNAGR